MSSPKSSAGSEIVSTRVFAATPAQVFAAFSEPSRLAQWWGPRGFTNTIHEFDLRPGGKWRLTMHGPDGANYENESAFVEIVPAARIVFQHLEPVHGFRMTMEFVARDAQTELTWTMRFDDPGEVARVGRFIADANEQNFDRLNEQLALQQCEPLVVAREFDAPRELVWRAWTEAEHFARWWGPAGATVRIAKFELQPGGLTHFSMTLPNGQEMWIRAIYREIVRPAKLVWVTSLSDQAGGIVSHPMWPRERLTVVTFTERAGKTTVTVLWAPLNATAADHDAFNAGRAGASAGWTGPFDKLAAYLASIRQ